METTQAQILDIQFELNSFGLYRGRLDGKMGPKTIEAIRAFQRLHPPLRVDGVCGTQTIKALFIRDIEDRMQYQSRPFHVPHQDDVGAVYGEVGTRQRRLKLPYKMKLAWDEDIEIDGFDCHELVHDSMLNIFEYTLEAYGIEEIKNLGLDLFGGCLNVRKMRGGNRYSMHSWGIAVDLDPARNQLRWTHDKANFAKPEYECFWDIVEECGAVSLGREKNYDWMHFQFAKL